MNSKCKTILGMIMLVIVLGVSAYYIVSEFSGAGHADEENVTLTNDVQKNYLSPISVNGFPIDKAEALTSSAMLLDMQLAARRSAGIQSLQEISSGINTLRAGAMERISSISSLLYPVVKERLMQQEGDAALEAYSLILDEHQLYIQNREQQELEDTLHHLFDNLFVTNDSKIDEYLNIRAVPNGDVIGRIYQKTGGTLLEVQNGWARVSSGEVTGWVSAEYILTGTQMTENASQLTVVVDKEYLDFKRAADTDSESMDILTKGTEVPFRAYSAGWVSVSYKGMTGYLKAEDVHLKAGSNTAVPMSAELWNETLEAAGLIEHRAEPAAVPEAAAEAPVTEAPVAAVPAAQAPAAPVVAQPSADELARQRIDALYAEGRSSMAPVYLSADEIYLLSCVIMMEAGAERYDGKLAVAGVVLNRLRSGYWGTTLHDVIYSPRQFTGAGTGLLANILASGPNEESVRAAYEACAGIHNIGGYMFFCSAKTAQYDQYSTYLVIDKQCFYAK